MPIKKVYSIVEWFNKQLPLANEGFINGQDSQAIVQGICYKQDKISYKGQLEVVANVLENTYLWDRIRLQGGAYGCDIMLTKEGYLSLSSYCDPHCKRTLKVFKEIGNYLAKGQWSSELIERAIVTTLGGMLMPEGMGQKSERAATYLITDGNDEIRQQIYDEIRKTTLEDFHEAAFVFSRLIDEGVLCIIGSKEKLEKQKHQLKLIDLNI